MVFWVSWLGIEAMCFGRKSAPPPPPPVVLRDIDFGPLDDLHEPDEKTTGGSVEGSTRGGAKRRSMLPPRSGGLMTGLKSGGQGQD